MLAAALVATRWAQFTAATLLVGASLFPFYASPRRPDANWASVAKVMRPLLTASTLVATFSALLWVGVSIVDLVQDVGGLFDTETLRAYFLETSFGKVWAFRVIAAIMLSLAALVARRRLFAPNRATVLIVALAATLLASQAWIGHPASLPGHERWIVTAAYGLHVVGGAVWLGALPPLGLLLAHSLRTGGGFAAELALRRFSPVGMLSVAAILLGGVVNALPRAQSLESFVASGWGRIVIFKFAAASAMIAIAAVNRFVLTPRLSTHSNGGMIALARNVALEQCAGLAILTASSLLAVVHPPGMDCH
ncbi:CopD family protein [Methylosinus sp. Ce-a6]|uniref:CopD family protein n=1 Tax=Methylosinus sp. Ce-a6 TaxID=2172005 RepID=UPI001356AA4D|nr:CopD family protein [Methylosinus sp. Ce-a6]